MMSNFKRTWSFVILLFASSFLIPFSSCGNKGGTAQEVEEAGTAGVDGTEHPEGEKSEHPNADAAEHPKAEENEHPKSNNE